MEMCAKLAERRVVDHLMQFKFVSDKYDNVSVHYSRLALAGGPMAKLLWERKEEDVEEMVVCVENGKHLSVDGKQVVADAKNDEEPISAKAPLLIDEKDQGGRLPDSPPRKEPVLLGPEHTPRTFDIIVKFLYCQEIRFNYLTFQEVVHLSTIARRWELHDLYHATFVYVMDQDYLAGGLGIRTFIPLVSHRETPEAFRRYFCIAVGRHFDVLYPRLRANTLIDTGVQLVVPPLWDVVITQNMLSHIIHCIGLYSQKSYDEYLIDVILRFYEIKEENDEKILGLLSQLNWDEIELANIFAAEGACTNWSSRAIRLAALASYAPQTSSLEVRIPWNIPLQKLIKQETWAFQTEHVLCGPYVCYLHVRKSATSEVSLFVHIWYRDGKPIGDEARHEKVRVKCRATEKNCRCDSAKQWSNSTHGFLENLKFEGDLKRYPGLGWSQFLEKSRLEEWRDCHGEDCGIAITTVLQFMNPKKQFEGPAQRTRPGSVRSSSPSKVQGPIRKTPRRPARSRESR